MFIWKLLPSLILTVGLLSSTKSQAQVVTLNKKDASLQEILLDVFRQTKYYFYSSADVLHKAKKITINVKDAPLKKALDICFRGQPLRYSLNGQVIVITEKKIRPVQPSHDGLANEPSNDTVTNELDQVQIIGYGTTTRRFSTGNISTVNSRNFEIQPVSNPLLALQGRVSGLLVTQTNGLPAAPVNVQIRGRNSIAANNNPLYIVDGVPFTSSAVQIIGGPNGDGTTNYGSPMNLINPTDIASIDILKDADATSIYGSRAANGVILITTKRGHHGKMKVQGTVHSGFGHVTRKPEMLSTSEYLQLRRNAIKNSNVVATTTNAPDLLLWDTTAYTDWQDWYIGGTASLLKASVAVSGGDARNSVHVSTNYTEETSVLPGDTRYKRANIHLNYAYRSKNKRLEISSSTFYTADKNRLTGSVNGALTNIITAPPNYPVYDESGNYYWAPTKLNNVAEHHSYYTAVDYNFNGNAILKYGLLNNLDVKLSFGYNNVGVEEIRAVPSIAKRQSPVAQKGSSVFGNQRITTMLLEPQLLYHMRVPGGKLDLLLGATIQQSKTDGDYQLAGNFASDDQLENIEHGTVFFSDSVNLLYKYLSGFARATYNIRDKYILSGSIRRDGSSRFGPGRRFGNFFSVSGAWIFSEESIFNDIPWLTYGKLRASYGTTGNDGIADYGFIRAYSGILPYGNSPAVSPVQPSNRDYRWESNRKFEIALENSFLRNRLFFGVAWYYNRSSDQLIQQALPTMVGFPSYLANIPAVITNSGIEFELNTVNIHRGSFKWTSNLNLSFPKNQLSRFPSLENSIYANDFVRGHSLNSVMHLLYAHTNPATGAAVFHDINGDGAVDPSEVAYNEQSGDRIIVGQNIPKWYGGLLSSVHYKTFRLDVLFQYVRQDGYNLFRHYDFAGKLNNVWRAFLPYWQTPGDNNVFPAPQSRSVASLSDFAASDFSVTDASFLRLKNVSLAFQIPAASGWFREHAASLYFQGQNLFTITNYSGYDPETAGNTTLMIPPLKVYTFGVQVTL